MNPAHARTLDFSFARRTPMILQAEAAECGLACLAMIAGHHGLQVDLPSLRARHVVSLKGMTLAELIRIAGALRLAPRPLRIDLEQLGEINLPCVLHWDFNHFVVLTRIRGGRATLLDPAVGRREVSLQELSQHFTGVALELAPAHDFKPARRVQRVSLRTLIGALPGVRSTLALLLALALALQVLALLAPFFLQWVVDQAIVSQDRDLLVVLAIGFALLAFIQAGVGALRGWMLIVLGTTLNLQLASNLFRHLIRLPMAWFGKRHVGDVMSRFESLNSIQRTLTTNAAEALIDGAMALATLALMLFYSVKLACVALLAVALYAGLRVVLYRPLRLASEEHIARLAKQQSHFLESVRGVQSIKLCAREEQRAAVWQNLAVDQFNADIRTQRLNLLYQTSHAVLCGVENVVTVWIGALLVLDPVNGFSLGMLFAFVAYKTQFMQRIAGLIDNGLELRMLSLHTERLADVALAPAEPGEPDLPLGVPEVGGALEIRNVSFRYADSEPHVIENVSLRVAEGESVAIIGPSGCGKTTLLKLILGLLNPTAGSIEVGGVPLSRHGLSRYRAAVASVMQDDHLFAGSIADNICCFDPQPDFARIEQCARMASVFDEITALPMRFNTLVGDMGTVLSGGQKQRILLARALYRQPKYLILDEATSHLDLARERSVNDCIRGLELTRIIVAHRPETIACADRVVVLSGGRVTNAMAVIEGEGGASSKHTIEG